MTTDFQFKKASDSGHWYTKEAQLIETLPGAKGQQVKPDIRHARKHDLCPGVTTIIKAADRPALTVYRERQVLLASLTLTRQPDETDDAWIDRIMQDSREHAIKAAERGSELHGYVERELTNSSSTHGHVIAVANELETIAPGCRLSWRSELPCVGDLGYATKSDLSVNRNGQRWVVDIKSKDGPLDELRLWDEHSQQLAATRYALATKEPEMIDAKCAILFLSRTDPQARIVVATDEQIQHGWECFKALAHYWQIKNKHKPTWSKVIYA